MKNETDIAVRNTAGALSSNLFEAGLYLFLVISTLFYRNSEEDMVEM